MLNTLIAPITSIINNVTSRLSIDKDLALKLQSEITKSLLDSHNSELKGAVDVIIAEANGGSWLQRNWRPLLMVSIVSVIVNNYILFPYLHAIGIPVLTLELPDKLYTLMEIVAGGYVIGRTSEKMLKTWKE